MLWASVSVRKRSRAGRHHHAGGGSCGAVEVGPQMPEGLTVVLVEACRSASDSFGNLDGHDHAPLSSARGGRARAASVMYSQGLEAQRGKLIAGDGQVAPTMTC